MRRTTGGKVQIKSKREGAESGGMHKKSANRIIALKLAELGRDFQFFPQGFPLLC